MALSTCYRLHTVLQHSSLVTSRAVTRAHAFHKSSDGHCRKRFLFKELKSVRSTTWRNRISVSAASEGAVPPLGLDGGSGSPPPADVNGSGGGGDGSEPEKNGKLDDSIFPVGKSIDNLPPEMRVAYTEGRVPTAILQRFFNLDANFFLRFLMTFRGLRERLLADPSFLVKLSIECGIGIFTKCNAEYIKRGDNFRNELDFVFANVLMAIVADYMLTYLPAPTLSYLPKHTAKQNALQRFLASCPENAFQKVPVGYSPFTVGQRVGAIVRNGGKLLGVGFGASLLGVGATNALIAVRQLLDPDWTPLNSPQNVLVMSAAYATYMASSSNLRYQVLAGLIEERGIEVVFKNSPRICNLLSFVLRTGNTFLGSLMWVDYIRLLGLQPKH